MRGVTDLVGDRLATLVRILLAGGLVEGALAAGLLAVRDDVAESELAHASFTSWD